MVILAAVGEKQGQDRIIQTAHDLATAYDDELRVLHVIPEEEADEHLDAIKSIGEFSDTSFTVEIDRAEYIAETLIERALPEDARERAVPAGGIGDPGDEILSYASTLDPRYLVIGGRKRSPVGKALFGSVTQSVILAADKPVVSVTTEA
jgi:nucleotide-binding universal stress UspA family protein